MYFTESVEVAKRQAADRDRVYYVCYADWHMSPDPQARYIVSEYLGTPAADHNSVKAQVFPNGTVRDYNGNFIP